MAFREVWRDADGRLQLESIDAGLRVRVVADFGRGGSRGEVKQMVKPESGVPTMVSVYRADPATLQVSRFKYAPRVVNHDTGEVVGEGVVSNGESTQDLSGVKGRVEDEAVLGAVGEALSADEARLREVATALLG